MYETTPAVITAFPFCRFRWVPPGQRAEHTHPTPASTAKQTCVKQSTGSDTGFDRPDGLCQSTDP